MSGQDDNIIILESDDEDDAHVIEKEDGDVVFVKKSQIPISPICIKTDDEDEEEDVIFVSATKPEPLNLTKEPTGCEAWKSRDSTNQVDGMDIVSTDNVNSSSQCGPTGTVVDSSGATMSDTMLALQQASMTICDDILDTSKTPTSMLCPLQVAPSNSTTGGSTSTGNGGSHDSVSTLDELQAYLQDICIPNTHVSNTTPDSNQATSAMSSSCPLAPLTSVAGAGCGGSPSSDLGRTPKMVLSVSDILNSGGCTDTVSSSDKSNIIGAIISDALKAAGMTNAASPTTLIITRPGAGYSDNNSKTNSSPSVLSSTLSSVPLMPSSSLSSFPPSSSSFSVSAGTSPTSPSMSSPFPSSSTLPSDLANVMPQPYFSMATLSTASLTSPPVVAMTAVSTATSANVVNTLASGNSFGVQSSSASTSVANGNITPSSISPNSINYTAVLLPQLDNSQNPASRQPMGTCHSAPTSPANLTQPVFKRSVSYMQLDPNQNNIPLKKRNRLQCRSNKIPSDHANFPVSVQTGGNKCTCCQTLVCFSQLSHCLQGHGCCGDCLQQKVKTLLSKAKPGSLKCPLPTCSSYFPMSQLQQTLPRMVVEILEEKLDREYIDYAADLVWQNLGESAVGGSTESTTNGEEDDMEDMETDGETAEGSGAVQSLSKEPSLVALPTHWDPMDDPSGYKKTELSPDTVEYEEIFHLFDISMNSRCATVVRISRIQNPILWQFYSMRRMQMTLENGGEPIVEKRLCHGTGNNVVDAICKSNFDWRLCGAHGTLYGQGSYFARDASYSHLYTDNARGGTYAQPNGKFSVRHRLIKRRTRQINQLRLQLVQNFQKRSLQPVAMSPTLAPAAPIPIAHQGAPALVSIPPPAHQNIITLPTSQIPFPMLSKSLWPPPAHSIPTGSQMAPVASTSSYVPQGGRGNRLMMLASLLGGTPQQTPGDVSPPKVQMHSMFIAKVLVGRYTHGKTHYRKPPPIDPDQQFGRCYDTCVDNACDPKIFVVFDSAQSYPEYLIEYNSEVSQPIV